MKCISTPLCERSSFSLCLNLLRKKKVFTFGPAGLSPALLPRYQPEGPNRYWQCIERIVSFVAVFSLRWHPGSVSPSSRSPEVLQLCSGARIAAPYSSRVQSCASTWCSWCPNRYWSRSRPRGPPRAPGRRPRCRTPRTCGCSRPAWRRCGPWKRQLPWRRRLPYWAGTTWDILVPQRTNWNETHFYENGEWRGEEMEILKCVIIFNSPCSHQGNISSLHNTTVKSQESQKTLLIENYYSFDWKKKL